MGRGRRTRRLLVSIGCVLTLVAVGAGCDWNQLGFDTAHTKFNPHEPALTPTSVANLALAWACTSCRNFVTPAPVDVADGTVFAPGFGDLHHQDIVALDAATGTTRWTQGFVPSTRVVAVANGLVYLADSVVGLPNMIFAADEATGVQRWSLATPAPLGPFVDTKMTVAGGRAFVVADGSTTYDGPRAGELTVLDTAGHVLWWAVPGGDLLDVAVNGDEVTALWAQSLEGPPTRTRLTTYSVSDGHVLRSIAVDLTDLTPGAGHPLTPEAPLTLAGGHAIFTAAWTDSQSGVTVRGLFVLDTTTGAIVWHVVPDDVGSFALAGGRLVTVTGHGGTGALVARDATTGAVQWSADVPATDSSHGTSVTVAGDVVYVAGLGLDMYAIGDGTHVGRFSPPAAYAMSAIPSEGHVYAFFQAALLALRPAP
jgi:outer membrane protein assembly factor BamB